jgi:hypothetical protein
MTTTSNALVYQFTSNPTATYASKLKNQSVMRFCIVVLAAMATIIAGSNAAMEVGLQRAGTSNEPWAREDGNRKRLLRSHENVVDDHEERGWSIKSLFGGAKKAKIPDDFAVARLQEMLRSPSFKREMFKTWDQKYTVGKIRESLKLERSPGYAKLLLDYLNKFERSTGLRE